MGQGGGQFLRARNIFSAEKAHTDGLYWGKPWKVAEDFGASGAAIAAANGRYAWLWSSDHWDGPLGWARGGGVWLGWSDDPGIPPETGVMILGANIVADTIAHTQLETPFLVLDPDDAVDPFRLYVHGIAYVANDRQNTVVFKSPDLFNWTVVGISHLSNAGGHAGYQRVSRVAEGVWVSNGRDGVNNTNDSYWTSASADGPFTRDPSHDDDMRVGDYRFDYNSNVPFLIGSDRFCIGKVKATDAGLGTFIGLIPVTEFGEIDTADPANDCELLSSRFGATTSSQYPGPKYLQSADEMREDGIAHIYPKRGFFGDTGLVSGADYSAGGGLDDQYCDYYTWPIPGLEAEAAQAAPSGVRASCADGIVTVQWYPLPSSTTFRVYRGTTIDTQATLVGDVTGTSIADTPSEGTYFYKVITMEGATERGSRIVRVYASSASELVNKHINRVLKAGGTDYNADTIAWAEGVLNSVGIIDLDIWWANVDFGVIKDGSGVISKIFSIGATLKPLTGDLTTSASNTTTTYSATAVNGAIPGWVNGTITSFSYFGDGRVNNIRRKTGITFVAAYQKTGTAEVALIGIGQMPSQSGFRLANSSGNPGSAQGIFDPGAAAVVTDTHGTTIANSAYHIIGATHDGATVVTYVEGVPSAGSAVVNTAVAKGYFGTNNDTPFLASGCTSSKDTSTDLVADRTLTFSGNAAGFSACNLIAIGAALLAAQMASLHTSMRNGP